jgi:hypothetical protein
LAPALRSSALPTALFRTAAEPIGGALPRDEPEKASPVEVPEIDVPDVVPAVVPSALVPVLVPLVVPVPVVPLDVVPVPPVALLLPAVALVVLLLLLPATPVGPDVPLTVLVAVVALGGVEGPTRSVCACAAAPARASVREVASTVVLRLRIEVSSERISG